MFRLLTLSALTLALSSCGEPDELIGFPPGDYISTCIVSGSDSIKNEISISRNFKSQTVQTIVFKGVSSCSGTGVAESEPVTNDVLIIFSNEDLGNDISYLTTTFEEDGVQKVEFIAFQFENSRLYFSPAVANLGDDPKETFADFILEPDFIADLILTRKDLNRPLSKN